MTVQDPERGDAPGRDRDELDELVVRSPMAEGLDEAEDLRNDRTGTNTIDGSFCGQLLLGRAKDGFELTPEQEAVGRGRSQVFRLP